MASKNSSPKSPQPSPNSSNTSYSSKTLVVTDTMEYNIVQGMNKIRVNISLHELNNLKHQQNLLLKELNTISSSPLPTDVLSQVVRGMGKPPNDSSNKFDPTDAILIGDRSNSHTPPFLLTDEIFNKKMHNFLIDSGASSNIMLRIVYTKLNVSPQKSIVHIVQLDRKKAEVLGEMNSVTIRLSSNLNVCQVIDMLVVDIPKFYGLILARD